MPTYDDPDAKQEIDLSPIAEASETALERIEALGWHDRSDLYPLVVFLECVATILKSFCGSDSPNFKVT